MQQMIVDIADIYSKVTRRCLFHFHEPNIRPRTAPRDGFPFVASNHSDVGIHMSICKFVPSQNPSKNIANTIAYFVEDQSHGRFAREVQCCVKISRRHQSNIILVFTSRRLRDSPFILK